MKNYIVFLALIFIIISCRFENKDNLKDKEDAIGELFIFPDTIEVLGEDTIFRTITYKNFIETFKNRPIVISIISGDCHICTSRLKKWNSIIQDGTFSNEIDYVFVISTSDKGYFVRTFYDRYEFIPELIIDNHDDFFKKNKFDDIPGDNTFLLDMNHKIKLRGNPVIFDELIETYIENIKSLK